MKIIKLSIENAPSGIVTDSKRPRFSFAISSEHKNVTLDSAVISVNGWQTVTKEQTLIPYGGASLEPFTEYTVTVEATDSEGETDKASAVFRTGRLDTPWVGKWITDGAYKFTEKKVSPIPMTFRRKLDIKKEIESATLYVTAMGVYEAEINGKKAGEDYLAPGFTSYKTTLQYQTYDVKDYLTGDDTLDIHVAGGWAVGSFVFTRKNRITADRQALLAELRLVYADGTSEVIATDESWEVTEAGPFRMADIYDGETFDKTVDLSAADWRKATAEKLRVSPVITAAFGAPVRAHETFEPISVTKSESGYVYDFGQNFAGVIRLKIKYASAGQKIVVRHAEILDQSGELMTKFLRSAKATATYICKAGEQEYSPRLTYMGFRYAEVSGIEPDDVEVTGVALYSDIDNKGSFECSDELINKLQSNIVWGGKSNFVDIPTDCPQRDERMGWTGDIAVFAPTACFNFDMSRFLEKWLNDVKNEQLKSGGIPNTVPLQGFGFPVTFPKMATAFWGDACVYVPYAEYLARGDKKLLEKMYPTMKRYVKACKFWAGLFSVGKKRYIWKPLTPFNFGDWVAPDTPKMSEWQKRGKWTSTASLRYTSMIVSKIAELLGKPADAEYYKKLSDKVADAYVSVLTDGNGKLKNEFQTAYVLPLYLKMFPEDQREKAAKNLAELVKKNGYRIGTGFPGTPYILFALADNGEVETAFEMLKCTDCPSWLYEVKAGATTVWERWDGLDENGNVLVDESGTDNMISYNHYAAGAVGDFLYRRIAGIEPTSGGYKTFDIKPLVGGGITYAKADTDTPFGTVSSDWKIVGDKFCLKIKVPVGTTCRVTLPNGDSSTVGSGEYEFELRIKD